MHSTKMKTCTYQETSKQSVFKNAKLVIRVLIFILSASMSGGYADHIPEAEKTELLESGENPTLEEKNTLRPFSYQEWAGPLSENHNRNTEGKEKEEESGMDEDPDQTFAFPVVLRSGIGKTLESLLCRETSIHKTLPLFVLFHSWKFHLI